VKYQNLRLIARILVVLAWVVGALIAILAIIQSVGGPAALSAVRIIVGLVSAFVCFVLLYALSQFIFVALDIEENTRETREAVTRRAE